MMMMGGMVSRLTPVSKANMELSRATSYAICGHALDAPGSCTSSTILICQHASMHTI